MQEVYSREDRDLGLFDRAMRLLRTNVKDVSSGAEDPDKLLEQMVMDLLDDLVQLRQAVKIPSIMKLEKGLLMARSRSAYDQVYVNELLQRVPYAEQRFNIYSDIILLSLDGDRQDSHQ